MDDYGKFLDEFRKEPKGSRVKGQLTQTHKASLEEDRMNRSLLPSKKHESMSLVIVVVLVVSLFSTSAASEFTFSISSATFSAE